MTDRIIHHLRDLVTHLPKDSVILAGGLGLMLKRRHLLIEKEITLSQSLGFEIPEARATTDIDLFLKIKLFMQKDLGHDVRKAIDNLQYHELTPKWQFTKPLYNDDTEQNIVVDLLARQPSDDEKVLVKFPRVGSKSGVNLHGREIIEGFAVERQPLLINVNEGNKKLCEILIAHPYAYLNMKVRAAYDWHRMKSHPFNEVVSDRVVSEKHTFDSTLIASMITETELTESKALALYYAQHPVAKQIRTEAVELFKNDTSPGWLSARRQGMYYDHKIIYQTIMTMLGNE